MTGRIAMIGDSITRQGDWTALLGREDVINWGHPGYTTGQLAWTFKDLIREHPALYVVFLSGGTNDLLLGVPADRIYQNQLDAVHYWRERGVLPVLQSITHQVGASATNTVIQALNTRLRDYCATERGYYLDLNAFLSENGGLRTELSSDGVHLLPGAYPLWAREVSGVLERLGY